MASMRIRILRVAVLASLTLAGCGKKPGKPPTSPDPAAPAPSGEAPPTTPPMAPTTQPAAPAPAGVRGDPDSGGERR
jgi:hypothetical protein